MVMNFSAAKVAQGKITSAKERKAKPKDQSFTLKHIFIGIPPIFLALMRFAYVSEQAGLFLLLLVTPVQLCLKQINDRPLLGLRERQSGTLLYISIRRGYISGLEGVSM